MLGLFAKGQIHLSFKFGVGVIISVSAMVSIPVASGATELWIESKSLGPGLPQRLDQTVFGLVMDVVSLIHSLDRTTVIYNKAMKMEAG